MKTKAAYFHQLANAPFASCLVERRMDLSNLLRFLLLILLFLFSGTALKAGVGNVMTNAPDESFEFAGQSELEYLDFKEGWKHGDVNRFVMVVHGCKWHLSLLPTVAPGQPTEVADDGTNYYVFAKGSGNQGSSMIGKKLRLYIDSASIMQSGKEQPKRHGSAPWLLLGSRCLMNSAAGDCGDVLEAYPGANPPKISYVNRYDLAKNSFGPCDIRISAAHTNGLEVRLIGRLEVLNSKQVDGYWIPTSVELRRFEPTGIEQSESTLLSIFRVSVDSFRKLGQLPSMVPKMERTTSTVDYRTGQTWEYIADQWKTETQASELMKSGNALLYPAPGTSTSGVGSSFILGGLIFVLAATTIMLKRMATRKQNITTS